MSNHTFTVPLQVGDTVTVRYIDGEMLVHEQLTVTEVCSKGFFVSSYSPPRDDLGDYILYDQLGVRYFLDGALLADRAGGESHE